jgi:hypothetical protein
VDWWGEDIPEEGDEYEEPEGEYEFTIHIM